MSHASKFLKETAEIAKLLDADKVEEMVQELVSLRERGGRLFVLGLGGSAANASHAVNDFRKLCGIEAYAPTDNVAELTARANDSSWDGWMLEYLDAQVSFKDALLVLSVGGGTDEVSIPISNTVSRYGAIVGGARILGIVGRKKGKTQQYGDCVIIIPKVEKSRITPHTEGWQSVILHAIVSHPDLQRNKTKW